MVEFNPTHEVREGVDVVWQIPPEPVGVLYLAHSRNGTPFSYWPSHPKVPQCQGVPEHQVVVKQALERRFAVIAGNCVTDEWETWPPSNVDVRNTVKILAEWRRENGLEGLPMSAWGTSCGGDFVSTLALAVKMQSLIVMISKGYRNAFESAEAGKYPATLWVPMIKDAPTFAEVKKHEILLKEKGIPTGIVEAAPLKVHPHFFAELIDEIDEDQSARLQAVFVEDGIVAEDYSLNKFLMDRDVEPYLRKAGILHAANEAEKQSAEEKLTQAEIAHANSQRGVTNATLVVSHSGGGGPRNPGGDSLGEQRGGPSPKGPKLGGLPRSHPLASKVSNQLKVAEGKHTLTSRHNAAVFDWLERWSH